MAGFDDLVARLDGDPNVRGRQFERIVKWWLRNDPVYRTQLGRVWLWDEWPGRWGPDAGIDVVAKTTGGELWAVQAKAYAPEHRITKRDIDTFLSESARPVFAYRLLVATTNQIGAKALRTLEEGLPAGLKLASDLGKAQVVWPDSPEDLRAPAPSRKEPYPHNQEAIDAVVDGFAGGDRGQLVMACGTGKTLIGLWVTERIEAQRTLVLLPSLSLLAQTLREWTANSRRPFAFLPVCSDETVRGEDHLVSHTAELGMPVTTNPADIATFLRKRSQPLVVFATYQSSPKVAEAFHEGRVPSFDLVIADEAHRVAGPVASDFATVLDDNAIRAQRRLFMTATPRYFTGRVRREAQRDEFEIASMDDEATFGPVFHQLSFGEAIERGLLTDYQVVIVGIDNPTYQQYVEHGRFVTRDGTDVTDARTLAAHISLAKTMRDFNLRRTISFHSRISKAKRFSSDFPEVVAWMPHDEQPDGELVTDFVSGKMPSGQRDLRLDRLRHLDDDQRGLLSNARCLGEGVDVPTLDGVAFIDPKGSLIDIIQAVGRAIRRADDKTVGTIVLPVYLEDTTNPDTALETSAFKPIWAVLKALRAHDEQLADQLDELRRQLGRQTAGEIRLPGRLHVDLPARVTSEFARAFEVSLVEQTTASWEFWYGLLQTYAAREGHSRVNQRHEESGWNLGSWVGTQRLDYRRQRLNAERRRRLEALPDWQWDPYGADWEQAFQTLRRYVSATGHARVEPRKVFDNLRLGQWVSKQRQAYRRRQLDQRRVRRLERLPGWTWDAHSGSWNERFEAFLQFFDRGGHFPTHETDKELTAWVARQRSLHTRDQLDATRKARLESIAGWTWDPRDDLWEDNYRRLVDLSEREGTCAIPQSFTTKDGFALGTWVTTQRQKRNQQALNEDRAKKLERLPGWQWDPAEARWEEGYGRLEDFATKFGHCRVPDRYEVDGFALGNWVRNQRRAYRNEALQPAQMARLEGIDGWSWKGAFHHAWETAYQHLQRFVEQEGHACVPASCVMDGFALGRWVVKQRSAWNRGSLARDRIARLERLQGWVWDSKDAAWDDGWQYLTAFARREGHGLVPADHVESSFRLGRWVGVQRRNYSSGMMTPSRVERLEGIPGWAWNRHEAMWESAYAFLVQFVRRESHSNVPGGHIEAGFRLGQWVTVQRRGHARGTLSQERERRLEALSGWVWDAKEQRWEKAMAALTDFAMREGHAQVPQRHEVDDVRLGPWVNTQRQAYRMGKLSPDRIAELEALPGWTWKAHSEA